MQSAGTFSLKRMLILLAPSLAIGAYVYWYNLQSPARARSGDQASLLKKLGIGQFVATELADRFQDEDGDLVADPPGDQNERIAPDPIVLSYIPSMDAGEKISLWDEFAADLSAVIRKPVDAVAFTDPEKHLAAFSNGDLHVTAFNTGMVPRAVASGGFVPVCSLGQQDGSFASYDLATSALGNEFALAGHSKLVPIRYKEDWRVVREVDRKLAAGREWAE